MNIREAKEEIVRTIRAYTAKDENGCYQIPVLRQRPVLLMGPPGIGKTAIMEQAAEECQVGLVAYTITHHTRQSAVGLPQLVERTFDGRNYTMTEYTMSEIVGAIYEYMERTGNREGILFIDEINCVSETLAPTMLQFLQYKTFGNHKVPEGWIIVAAGNPPEFNKSVRELDMAALDRVRTIEVEADLQVWEDYAYGRGVHPAILAYLEMKPEHFYQVTKTHEKLEFVTARGWEDLSAVLLEYERQGMPADRSFMAEFLRCPKIAADFASYYRMYQAYARTYRIGALLDGSLGAEEQEELLERLRGAAAEVRCMFVKHLLAAASERMTDLGRTAKYVKRLREVQEQLLSWSKGGQERNAKSFFEQRKHALGIRKEHGLMKDWEEPLERRIDEELEEWFLDHPGASVDSMDPEMGSGAETLLEEKRTRVHDSLDRATDFLEAAFGKELELMDWLHGIRSHGDFALCDFERPEFEELSRQREQERKLQKQMTEMEELYETADRI